MEMIKKSKGAILMILKISLIIFTFLIFGFNGPVMKFANILNFHPIIFASYRCLLSLPPLLILLIFTEGFSYHPIQKTPIFIMVGFLTIFLPQLSFALSIYYTSIFIS
jgi:drug/metabolite transporter (DMT)-like permease